jgi:prevent-host-death family protein
MRSFTLTDIRDRSDEVFEQAAEEPILLTQESQPSYVLLSIHDYQQLIERLAALEDRALDFRLDFRFYRTCHAKLKTKSL